MTLTIGCKTNSDEPFVARVADAKLYTKVLQEYIPATVSREDSIKRAKVIINNWVREQVVLQKARYNMEGSEDRFQAKVDEYLNDLIIYDYENRFVREKLDTVVTEQELRTYYETHKKDFKLRDHALRVRYGLYDSDTKGLSDIAKKMKRYNELDSMEVSEFSMSNAKRFNDRTQQWIRLNDLLEAIPLSIEGNVGEYFEKSSFKDIDRRGQRIILAVEEYLAKGSVSPYGLEREVIRNTILNSRKISMLEQMRSELFSEAIRHGDIEIIEE